MATDMHRPVVIAVAAWLFIIVGALGLFEQVWSIASGGYVWDARGARDFAIVASLRALALVGGVFLLRGANWARWMLLIWMAYHIQISLAHSWTETAVHVLIFGAITYLLFRRGVAPYFRHAG